MNHRVPERYWLLLSLLLFACNRENSTAESDSVLLDEHSAHFEAKVGGIIPAYPQRKGDPAAGRQALLNNSYVSCGLPLSVFEALPIVDDVVRAPDRVGKAQNLPYSFNVWRNDKGQEVVSSNCLSCHGSTLFGELVIGLGNEFNDFTNNASDLVEQSGVYVRTDEEAEIWQQYADRLNVLAPYMQTRTVGVNPANNITMALIAHRDRHTNAWSDQALLALDTVEPPPVSVPPWWRMKKKHAMFNMGEGRGDHARIMMAVAMFCSDTVEELESIDTYAPDIRAFIDSVEAPEYPFSIDTALSKSGEEIFNKTCSMCHGTYGNSPSYPNRLVDIDVVGTDPLLVEFANGQGIEFAQWFNESYFGQLSKAVPSNGYVAPPLDGIWVTGPFLHNGSVPTIRQVLDSSTRPTFWQHSVKNTDKPAHYNQTDLGWQHESVSSGHADQPNEALRKYIYDTSLPGYSNQGHRFGDHLNNADRTALLEYLKTL